MPCCYTMQKHKVQLASDLSSLSCAAVARIGTSLQASMHVTLELWKAVARGMGDDACISALVMLPEGARTVPEPNADQALVKWLRDSPDAASARYCRSSCRISLPDVLSMRLTPEGAMETCRGSTSLANMRGT